MLSTTFSYWWLFLVDDYLWLMTDLRQSHKLICCVVDVDHWISLMHYLFLKSENESITFCCWQQFFHNFSSTSLTLKLTAKVLFDNYILFLCQQPKTLKQIYISINGKFWRVRFHEKLLEFTLTRNWTLQTAGTITKEGYETVWKMTHMLGLWEEYWHGISSITD